MFSHIHKWNNLTIKANRVDNLRIICLQFTILVSKDLKFGFVSPQTDMVAFTVKETKVQKGLKSIDIIRNKSYIICLANCRDNKAVIFVTQVNTKLSLQDGFKL